MTTIQATFAYEPPIKMADDSMEISSEFGQNAGDDDIDIDIDLAAGQNDEDYILEDAKSDIGLGGNYTVDAVSLQAAGNDDPMVDDEHASYVMDDVEFIPENNLYYQQTDIGVSGIGTSNLGVVSRNDSKDGRRMPERARDRLREPEAPLRDADKQEGSTADTATLEGEVQEGQVPVVSPPISPLQDKVVAQEDSGLETFPLIGELKTDSNTDYSKDHTTEVGNNPDVNNTTVQRNDEPKRLPDREEVGDLTSINAIVVYRDAEYALISSSETDDPDSFFLKDDTVTKMPLASFFSALRGVLIDDLAPEDELCLAFEELGLEVIETSKAVCDVTFAQIINLRDSLMRNDGIESPGPIYVTLGTKINFSKRMATLTAGVNEGKGFSEFVSWEEVSESFGEADESGQFVENVVGSLDNSFDHKDTLASTEAADVESAYAAATENRSDGEVADSLLGSTGDGIQSEPNKEDARDLLHADRTNVSLQEQGEVNLKNDESTPKRTDTGARQDDLDEDGDLIDYEDEEYEQAHTKPGSVDSSVEDEKEVQNGNLDSLPPCLQLSCFCPKCIAHFLNENEVINEDLHRQSATEDTDTKPLERAEVVSPDVSYAHQLAVNLEDGAGGERDQNNVITPCTKEQEAEENFDITKDYQYTFEPNDFQVTDDGVTHNGEGWNDLRVPNLDEEPEEDEDSEEHIDLEDDEFNGLDYGHNVHEFEDIQDSQASNVHEPDRKFDEGKAEDMNEEEIDYEETFETLDSNGSEHTIAGDDPPRISNMPLTEDTHDEINYDEEDDNQLDLAPSPQIKSETSTGSGSTGKRTRTETEDVVDRGSKGPKRARS